jgi:hypothetical protein
MRDEEKHVLHDLEDLNALADRLDAVRAARSTSTVLL